MRATSACRNTFWKLSEHAHPVGHNFVSSYCKETRNVVCIPECMCPAKIRRSYPVVERGDGEGPAPQYYIPHKYQVMGAYRE